MDERERLAGEEAEGWAEVLDLVDRLTPEELERRGLSAEGWSVKDLLWHLRCWMEEAARQLAAVRRGAYEEREWDTDGLNARYLEEGRGLDLATVRMELERSRARALAEWSGVTELSAPVIEWFGESGAEHYAEHLKDLRSWVDQMAPGRSPDLAARRASKLAVENAAWRDLNELITGLSPAQLEAPGVTPAGWSVKDTMWHIACWSADCVRSFERMRAGTFEGEWQDDDEIEAINRRWYEESRELDLDTVKAAWFSARTKMVECFGTLEELSAEAQEWFDESGTIHYEKHLIDLRPWIPQLVAGA